MSSSEIQSLFESAGQGHVFRFFDSLGHSEQRLLIRQAEAIDLGELRNLIETLVLQHGDGEESTGDIEPAPYIPLPEKGGCRSDWEKAREIGEEAIRSGRLAAFTPAGGQGTRLGYDAPKGSFPVTPVTQKPLFQVFAEKILAGSKRYGVEIPWYIMTSEGNHDATVAFFEERDFFGLNRDKVRHFSQGTMPAVDFEGRIIMSGKGKIATSPDGHGGSMRALVRNGCIDEMKDAGIDCVSFFQIDNPLVRCVHPEFVGFHLSNDSELSSKTCLKAYPEERVGVFVKRNGQTEVLEYSDLSDELTHATDENGELRIRAGSIAIHIFDRDLIGRIGTGSDPEAKLPFHRAEKKVPSIDEAGNRVSPAQPNGVKFEMFGFDALPFARNPVVVETSRADEFSPVKNAEGVDSPKTAREDQLRQFARWVQAAGLEVSTDESGLPGIEFEISPLFAQSAEEFAENYRGSKLELRDGTVFA